MAIKRNSGIIQVLVIGLLLLGFPSCVSINNTGEDIQESINAAGIELPGRFSYYKIISRGQPVYCIKSDKGLANVNIGVFSFPYFVLGIEIPCINPIMGKPVDDDFNKNSKKIVSLMIKHNLSGLIIDGNTMIGFEKKDNK